MRPTRDVARERPGARRWLSMLVAAAAVIMFRCTLGTTGGEVVTFSVFARGARAEFETATGWHVRLDEAWLNLAALRWQASAPAFGSGGWRASIGMAWAHPGHAGSVDAIADIALQRAVNLVGESVWLGRGQGVSGDVRSASVTLAPAPAADVDAGAEGIAGQTVFLRGVATRDGRAVRFRAGVSLQREVAGLIARGAVRADTWGVTLVVDLSGIAAHIDFDAVRSPGPGNEVVLADEGQAANAIARGVASASTYAFEFQTVGADR